MAEILMMGIIGAVVGGFLVGGGHWLQQQWTATATEKENQRIAEKKRKLSPRLDIQIFPDHPEMPSAYKHPLIRYTLIVQNLNLESVPILDLRIEFNFKSVVAEVKPSIWVATGEDTSVGGIEIHEEKTDGTTYDYVETKKTGLEQKFSFEIRQANINKDYRNTNFIDLYVGKWEERASAFHADIIVNVTERATIRKKTGEYGSYHGAYSYEINGKKFSEKLGGGIPDGPSIKAPQEATKS